MDTAGITQRLDAVIVGNHVAELDDLRHAAEVFNQAGRAAEGLSREVINGNLTVVEIGVGNSGQVLENKVLNNPEVLANCGGTYLLMVADDEHGLPEIEGHEGQDVTLAGFIDDDDVKARYMGLEILHYTGKRSEERRVGKERR